MRFLVCAFLAIAAIHATKACTPGEKKQDGPNTCFCLGDGLGWVCAPGDSSPLAIPRNELLRERRQVEESKDSCEPGTYFRSFCNSCRCADDGKISSSICTMKGCLGDIWNEDGSLKNPEEITDKTLVRQTRDVDWSSRTCEPGTVFKFFCNECKCGNDGLVYTASCTRMYCDPLFWNEDGTPIIQPMIPGMEINPLLRQTRNVEKSSARCVPGSSFKYYCNNCACGDDGLVEEASCTRMPCDLEEWNEDGTRKYPEEDGTNVASSSNISAAPKTCIPGTVFKFFCNDCKCGNDGLVESASCTRMYCNPLFWNEDGTPRIEPMIPGMGINPLLRQTRDVKKSSARCVPGSFFKYYCNNCACGDDGLVEEASCTRMRCDLEEWNEDGTRKYPEEDGTNVASSSNISAAPKTCIPGSSFKYYCNNCACGDDGLVEEASCTRMPCDLEEWNEDGTRKYPEEDGTNVASSSNILTRQSEASKTCIPGSSFKYYCNDCYCLEDGLLDNASCTRMACAPGEYNEDGSRNWPEEENTNTQIEDLDDSNDRFLDPTPVKRVRRAEEVATGSGTGRCVPGTSFKYYCNDCYCEDGVIDNAYCTRMFCFPGEYNEDGSRNWPEEDNTNTQIEDLDDSNERFLDPTPVKRVRRAEEVATAPGTGRCVPGTSFKYYCNDCYCEDGIIDNASCTRMLCDLNEYNEDGSRKYPEEDDTNTQIEDLDDSNERFLDPTPVKADKTKHASQSDVSMRQAEEVATAPQTCVPGSSFKYFCNHCSCPEDGLLDFAPCTRMSCRPGEYNEDGSRNYPEEDETNKENVELDDSNDRFLDPTRIHFPSFKKREAEEGRCRTGEIFRNFCNYCFCGTDGTIAGSHCTEMACDLDVWNKDGTKKSEVPLLRNERSVGTQKVCEPNSTFKKDSCNSCTCNSDGTSAVCTLMDCLN